MNKTSIAQQSKVSSFIPHSQSILQRKCACGNHTTAGGECAECAKKKMALQRKLAIGASNDPLEQEADRVADQVMAAPLNSVVNATPPRIQRFSGQANGDASFAPPSVDRLLAGSGRPLDRPLRQDMEQRFGYDFSQVRVHTGSAAEQSARDVNAHAYTVRNNVVFGAGQYAPSSQVGRRLIAHELTHVVQQRSVSDIQQPNINKNDERYVQSKMLHVGKANHVVQRWPGDGIDKPGDCGWGKYLVLRGSVETAKVVVSTLGRCSPGEDCLILAAKIAAVTAEIGARVALMTTCFKGGDTEHRGQVQDKINMMNRCYRHFSDSNCSPELIEAMVVVVESVRAIIAAAATVVAIALVVALIAAIIALAEVIAALAAAAAEAVAVGAAAAAVIALLVLINDELSSEDSSGT